MTDLSAFGDETLDEFGCSLPLFLFISSLSAVVSNCILSRGVILFRKDSNLLCSSSSEEALAGDFESELALDDDTDCRRWSTSSSIVSPFPLYLRRAREPRSPLSSCTASFFLCAVACILRIRAASVSLLFRSRCFLRRCRNSSLRTSRGILCCKLLGGSLHQGMLLAAIGGLGFAARPASRQKQCNFLNTILESHSHRQYVLSHCTFPPVFVLQKVGGTY